MTIKLCVLVRNRRYNEDINGGGNKCMRLCTNYKRCIFFQNSDKQLQTHYRVHIFYLYLLLGFDHCPVEMLVFPKYMLFSTFGQSPFSTLLKIRYFSKILKYYEFIVHFVSALPCKPASLDFVLL